MANYIAWISLDSKKLACGELEAILGVNIETNSVEQKLYADPSDRIVTFSYDGDATQIHTFEQRFSALAGTLRICKIIETIVVGAPPQKLKHEIDTPSYRIDFLNSLLDIDKETAQKFFKLIYNSVKTPKVNLKKPATTFFCYVDKNTGIISEQIWLNDYAYEKRRSHLREKTHSAVMHPKLVRTMINLSGIVPFAEKQTSKSKKSKQITLLDPFCGTGGILIEAMHCGFHVAGSDIDPKMKSGAKTNIVNEIKKIPQFSALCDVTTDIKKVSALDVDTHADVIVTDVPYAKNTKKLTPPTLYLDFLNHIATKKLANKIVICFPNYAYAKDIIAQTPWVIKNVFYLPVHNSLTRELYILTSK